MVRLMSLYRFIFFAFTGILVICSQASASILTLNASGIADGLTISTFVSGFPVTAPGGGQGPNGSTYTSDGHILVGSFLGQVYEFTDTDNQTVSNAISTVNAFTPTGTTPFLANLNGSIYMSAQRQLFQLNNDGSVRTVLLGGALVTSNGLAADPANGHLYANSNIDPSQNLADINVANNTYSLHPAGGGSVSANTSPDGATVYLSHYPVIQAVDTTTYATIWTSNAGGAAAVIPTGLLAGDLLAYDQVDGILRLLDKDTGSATDIAYGGFQGNGPQFGFDGNNGTLLLAQGDSIIRISFTNAVPEPSSCLLVLFALLALPAASYTKGNARYDPKLGQITFLTIAGQQ